MNATTSTTPEQLIQVSYTIYQHIFVPQWIDLTNHEQVKEWYVKFGDLNVIFTDEFVNLRDNKIKFNISSANKIIIKGEEIIQDIDMKFPSETTIHNCVDFYDFYQDENEDRN